MRRLPRWSPTRAVLLRTLWTLGLVAICGPSGAAGWATAHEMVQAQYLMVGRFMAAHFERAAAMAEAVQAQYEYTQSTRGDEQARYLLDTKSHYGYDLATIMVSYLDKVQAVQWDGMSQTASAILMELTAQAVPVHVRQIKCCAFQEAVGRLFDLWQEVLLPTGTLRTYNAARQHVQHLEADGVDLTVLAGRLRRFQAVLQETMPAAAQQCARLLVTLQRLQSYRD